MRAFPNWITSFLQWLGWEQDNNSNNNGDTETEPIPEESENEMSLKRMAVCVGINNYPGTSNDLRGCVNDAKNWHSILKNKYKFSNIQLLLDRTATHAKVLQALRKMINKAKKGDSLVFTYSGHGTSVVDRSGDEADGRDEALCLYDKLLIDDEVRSLMNSIPKGVKFTVISDSCHSGTVTRLQMSNDQLEEEYLKARYMPPKDDAEAMLISNLPVKKRVFSEKNMSEILVTGCKNTEYSYDAYIGGKPQGAMSYYASEIIKANPKINYDNFYKKLRKRLPSGQYPQTPQLEGSKKNRTSKMFVL